VTVLVIALLIVLLLFVVGFWAVKLLIWLAIILAVVWLIGYLTRGKPPVSPQ
jgi:hypothetical protein